MKNFFTSLILAASITNSALAYQEGEFPGVGSEENFQKALTIYKSSQKIYGDNAKAIEAINKAISIYPYDAQFWFQLGMLVNGKVEKLQDFSKAASLNSDYVEPWYQMAQIYCDSEKYDDAIKAAKKACEIKPEDPTAWFILSTIYKTSGNFKESKKASLKCKELQKSLETKPIIGPIPSKTTH